MLLSRFWYLLLAAAGAVAVVAALSTQVAFNRQYEKDLDDQLRRDRYELELNLKILARSQLDAIAPLAGKDDVRNALRRVAAQIPPEEKARLQSSLVTLNRQLSEMQADLLFAVDRTGTIVVQIGDPQPPEGAGLGAFPLVAQTLNGYVGDDVWVYNDNVYRMAAWPVVNNNEYVGAIVHGMQLDSELAERLSRQLVDANVAFFRRDHLIGSHVTGRLTSQMVETLLPQALQDEHMNEPAGTSPLTLGPEGKAVFSLVTGSASRSQVGFVIARPLNHLGSPLDVFDQVADEDVGAMTSQATMVGGVAFAAFLLAMLIMYLERDRPLGKLKAKVLKAGKPDSARIDVTDLGGQYRNIALGVNEALDRVAQEAGESGSRKKAANLDEILGPSPGPTPAPYFGFADKGEGEKSGQIPAIPPAPGPGPTPPKPAAPPPGPPKPAAAPPGPPPGPPPAAAPPKPAPPRPMLDTKPEPKKENGAAKHEAKLPAATNGPESSLPSLPSVQSDLGLGDDDEPREESTMVAQIPEELLAQSGAAPAAAPAKPKGDEESHFREVYEKFLATKKECGEPTAGLTLDKFKETLKKNRDQIVNKHGAKSVRFTVYVKDGKAALKATPVRE